MGIGAMILAVVVAAVAVCVDLDICLRNFMDVGAVSDVAVPLTVKWRLQSGRSISRFLSFDLM